MKLMQKLGIDIKTLKYVLGVIAAVVTAILSFHELVHKNDYTNYITRSELRVLAEEVKGNSINIARIQGKTGM